MSGHIAKCLKRLTDDQIWSRGNPNENAVGNLVLHLCGNIKQWIGSGVGGVEDTRNRDSEFATERGASAGNLTQLLETTINDACQVLETVKPERLVDRVEIQNRNVSLLEAVYHAVGHFQQHGGQIIFATKLYTGEDLGLQRPLKQHA